MGKWVYQENESTTSALELKRMCSKALTASLKSKVEVNVEYRVRNARPTINDMCLTFFQNDDILCINFYCFYSIEKNTSLLEKAFELMKDSSKYEKFK